MVHDEVSSFMTWLRSRGAIPTIVALRESFESTRQQELARLAPKLESLPVATRMRIEEITHLLIEKLLSAPTEQLKAALDEKELAADANSLERLFRLDASTSKPKSQNNTDAIKGIKNRESKSSRVKHR